MLCCGMPGAAQSATLPHTTSDKFVGVQKILSSIDQLQTKADGKDQDIQFLSDLLANTQLQSLIKVHEKVAKADNGLCLGSAVCKTLADDARQVYELLNIIAPEHPQAKELIRLLQYPHFEAIMVAHDCVAERTFVTSLAEIPYEVDEDDDITVKIIQLVKSFTEPLGATLQVDDETGAVFIARVLHGGAADRSGMIHPGDEIRQVNGVAVTGKQPDDVIQLISNAVGPVTLTLVPGSSNGIILKECKIRVRAQFSYDPADDSSVPCREAALAFQRGDMLEILSQDDAAWWQARRDASDRSCHTSRVGLIPSRLIHERIEDAKPETNAVSNTENKENKGQKSIIRNSQIKKPKKTKKSTTISQKTDVAASAPDPEDSVAIGYEEVERYCPMSGLLRPLVLIGAAGVGRRELRNRLIASNPSHFKEPVSFTSIPPRSGEVNGDEYTFVNRAEMENDIINKRFVEHIELNGNLYGTTFEQITSIINAGLVCVLAPNQKALRAMRCAKLKPFIIHVRPVTSLERLMTSRAASSRQFTEAELEDMIDSSAKIDSDYGHLVDWTLINDDLDVAATELRQLAVAVETEPFWVPAAWLR